MKKNRGEQKETEVLLSRRETKKGGGKKRKKIKTDKKRRGEGEDRTLAYLFHPLLFVFKRISLHSSAFLVPLCPSLFSSTSFLHTSGKGRNETPRRGRVRKKESWREVKNTLVRQCRGEKEIVVAKEGWKFWAVARWRIAL